MNQPARPAANAFPGAARASADPARPQVASRAVPAGAPQPGRPVAGQGVPGQGPQPVRRPQQPQAPQRPQAAPLPQAPQRAPRPQVQQRPQVAPPQRPLPQAAPRPQSPPRPNAPVPAAPQVPQAAPAPAKPATPEQPGPPPRPRKRKIGRWVALLVIAAGVGGAAWYGTHTAPATSGVGDCLAQTAGDQLTKVSCSDQGARFRVLGKLENKTMVDASLDACAAFPTATSAYWEGESGEPGLVLCLEPVTPAKK